MKHIEDKVVAITGAGSGIGRALALELARRGARLSLSDVDEVGLAETVRLVGDVPEEPLVTAVDVASNDAVCAWAQQTWEHFGVVHGVINNAGVALSGTVEGVSVEDYTWIMGINLFGVIHGTKAFLPMLEASGDGHVVNLSSVFGLAAQPLMSGYNASKFAVRGFTDALRQELALQKSNVSVTCVYPGGIRTNIARQARVDDSVQDFTGLDKERSTSRFERAFRTTPAQAARKIVEGMLANRRSVLIGPDAYLIAGISMMFPTLYEKIIGRMFRSR